MSNFTNAAYHPPSKTIRSALFLDDYFGKHEYGVKFPDDDHVYPVDEVKIPLDKTFYLNEEIKVNVTLKDLPEEDQDVLYWLKPFEKWFIGKFDGEWTFYSKYGFCDGHDAPFWIDINDLPDPISIFGKDKIEAM